MIIKVKTLIFCENFMGTETFTKWHVNPMKINLSGKNLLILIYYIFIYLLFYLFIYKIYFFIYLFIFS